MIHFLRQFLIVCKTKTANYFATIVLFISVFCYSCTGFLYFEIENRPDLTWLDSMWWSFVTMTTVGYGDLFPESAYGRLLVGLPTMLLGVSILGYILSVLASYILESKIKEIKGLKKVKLVDHIIVCRYNSIEHFEKIISEIREDQRTKKKQIVLIDDRLDELPSELVEKKITFIKGCPSRETILRKANFTDASHILIQADVHDLKGSDHANLAIALTIEMTNSDIFTIVECLDPQNVNFFKHAKVDSIICRATLASQVMVQEIQDPGVNEVISELTSNEFGGQIYLKSISKNQTVAELRATVSEGETLIGVRQGGKNIFSPNSTLNITSADQAILIAEKK